MTDKEDFIRRLERAELIREGKPLPESVMTEYELDLALEKELRKDSDRARGRII